MTCQILSFYCTAAVNVTVAFFILSPLVAKPEIFISILCQEVPTYQLQVGQLGSHHGLICSV